MPGRDQEQDGLCPSAETLFGLLVGTLDDKIAAAVIRHVESCKDCQLDLENFDATEDSFVAEIRGAATRYTAAEEFARQKAVEAMKALVPLTNPVGGGQDDNSDTSTIPKL